MKTANQKIERDKHTIDAKDVPLGRLANECAQFLLGKNKPNFEYHWDMGDYVTVTNAKAIKLTGRKWDQKQYHRFTGYSGNLKSITAKKLHEEKPTELVRKAVYGMLPDNTLRKGRMKRLTIFAEEATKEAK